jgi:predicted DNA-binding ribbon-helix-helix protein
MGDCETAEDPNAARAAWWSRRTLRIGRQPIRLRLEVSFWQALDEIATREGMKWGALCQEINRRRGAIPLARSIRCLVMDYHRTATPPADRTSASALGEVLSQVFD